MLAQATRLRGYEATKLRDSEHRLGLTTYEQKSLMVPLSLMHLRLKAFPRASYAEEQCGKGKSRQMPSDDPIAIESVAKGLWQSRKQSRQDAQTAQTAWIALSDTEKRRWNHEAIVAIDLWMKASGFV